jgi:hypothetical protein
MSQRFPCSVCWVVTAVNEKLPACIAYMLANGHAGTVARCSTATATRYMHGHGRMEEEIKKRSRAQLADKN